MASSSSKTLPLFLLLTCSLLCSSWPTAFGIRFPDHDEVLQKFKQWMTRYGREYKDEAEKLYRLGVFTNNSKYVDAFFKSGERSYSVGLNQFADLTNEEFLAGHTGLKQSNASKPTASHFSYDDVTTVPATVDWRSRGVVTSVKDQGSCGSCWAFSSVAAMESIILIKKRKQLDLSEQELVDCDFFNSGCNGGWMNDAFDFVIRNGGITSEAKYPYVGRQRVCRVAELRDNAATISGFVDVPDNEERALMVAVAQHPVSVAIDAGGLDFQLYTGGVFSGPCGTTMNHAVTVVGYGEDGRGNKYWIAKNSWGASWGDGGYVLMKKDVEEKEGLCGIAMHPSYPTI
ncbi:hypothetical protein Cni_G06388 [Canna indica]|uniref:Uncharacterized protein n=1 Tax=Canna indica TaxID=4628 RepID=A0AAQ3Q3Z6_9LILI|nr:hypothetical protein Cni_G06388 [Canna indica]